MAAVAEGIEAFCRRLQPTLESLTFAQRRQLVELLIDRVIVNDSQVEIRYVVPTGPKGETIPFCQLRLDYFTAKPPGVLRRRRLGAMGAIRDQIPNLPLPRSGPHSAQGDPQPMGGTFTIGHPP